MNRALAHRLTATLLALSSALLADGARAQAVDPDTLAAARALHNEALVALDAKNYASACPKLEQVVKLVPQGLGARLTLAECYEGAGRLASAWKIYVALEEAAAKEGQHDRQRLAGRKAAELRPKLGRLAIRVPEALRALPGLEIRRGADVVGAAVWGIEVPVDRGEYVIAATATGKRRWEKKVAVQDGGAVSVEVGGLEDDKPAVVATPPQAKPRPSAAQPPNAAPALAAGVDGAPLEEAGKDAGGAPWGAQRIAGVVVGGVGVVGIGVGAIFGLQAMSKKSDSNADGHCHDGNQCDDEGFALREDGRTAGTISTVMFLVGGAALAGGATLFLTAPRGEGVAGAEVAVGPQGIALRGRW